MTSPASLFLYEARVIRILSVSPGRGPTAGGTEITIVGEGFAGLATGGPVVDLGGAALTVSSFTDTQIVGITDPHIEEVVDVEVTNSDGDIGTLAGGFDYTDGTPPIDVVFRTPAGAVARLARVENPPARISQSLGQPPQMTFSSPVEPKGYDPVAWTSFGQLLFDGVITKSNARTEGRNKEGVWDCSCLGFQFLLSKRFPVGEWVQVSATTVLQELMSTFGQGFNSQIEPALDAITLKLDGAIDLWSVLVNACERAGAKCFLASTTFVAFTVSSSFDPPAPVTDDNPDLCWPESGQAVSYELDYQQLANSVTVYGALGVFANRQDPSSISDFGLCPLPIYDNTLTTLQECMDRAQQIVEERSQPVPTAKYSTRDLKTMAGKTVTISVSAPEIDDDFIIQNVEIDQLELLAVGEKPRFTVTCVPSWAPAMQRSDPVSRLLQEASDVVAEQARSPRLDGDVTSEPGGPTVLLPGSIPSDKLAGCIPTDKLTPGPNKDPVVAATAGAIVRSGLQTISGVALKEGDRVLVKDQADPSENGIYIASDATGLWLRATDADEDAQMVPGIAVVDANLGILYYLDATAPVVVGSSALSFVALGGGDIKSDGSVPFAADESMGGFSLTDLADPSSAQDAATKAYVDAVAQGLTFKAPVRIATTANLAALSGLSAIDGVTPVAGDRILVKDQTAGADNGIYVAAAGAWARSGDANSSAEVVAGIFTFVTEGTANGDKGFVLSTNNPIVLGTTALVFVQMSSGSGGDIRSDGTVAFAADQSMGGFKLTNLAAPSSANDAARKTYVDTEDATFIKLDGSRAFTGNQSLGAHKLTNVTDPTSAQDAATKAYVDAISGAAINASVYRATNQTLTHNTEAALSLSTADFDTSSIWSAGSPTRMTCPAGGTGAYLVRATIRLGAGFKGVVHLRIYKNGSFVTEQASLGADAASDEFHEVASIVALVPTDYVEVKALLELAAGSGTYDAVGGTGNTFVQVARLSPQTGSSGGGGGLVLLEEHSASASASLDFTTRNKNGYTGATFQSDFDEYVIELLNVVPATNGCDVYLRFSVNGGSSYDATNKYSFCILAWNGSGGNAFVGATISSPDTRYPVRQNGEIGNSATYGLSGKVTLYQPLGAAYKRVICDFGYMTNAADQATVRSSGVYQNATAVNALQWLASSGNLTSGTIRIYGVSK